MAAVPGKTDRRRRSYGIIRETGGLQGRPPDQRGENMMRCGRQPSRGPRSTWAAVLCAFVVFCAFHAPAQAQRVGSAVNPSASKEASSAPGTLRFDYSQTPVAVKIALPDADAAIKQSMTQSSGGLPLQIGVHRAMSNEFQGDLSPKLDWEEMGDGSIVLLGVGDLTRRLGDEDEHRGRVARWRRAPLLRRAVEHGDRRSRAFP